ncbi:putative amino acid ABC transporter permease protein [Candidatus Promineifilum breve]|uniref:Amino acid ABC transporter permease protein n=1 Tax=Candidatus Promineifilum breve TaxID=1806508 RepID=A0A170PHN5_9CHLR|nr:ABC transporter permease subunit [Candidatus Promineifilum breve]CUS04407.2 putative amino acid ABC transporter permease protein [Candidatus Promineifilum breve]
MTNSTPPPPQRTARIPFWRDIRVLGVIAQIAFLIVVLSALGWVAGNVGDNLSTLGESQFLCRDGSSSVRCAFDFLRLDAQFAISESLIPYDPSDSYGRALLVGALNTIKVAALGIVLATVLGTVTGIARLSSNWLIRNVARWYVDLIRNTPLLLQLFFLFFGVILLFPPIREAVQPFGLPIFLSQRGINLPGIAVMPSFTTWLLFLGGGLALAGLVWWWLGRRERQTERNSNRPVWSLLAFLAVAAVGWFVASAVAADNQGFLVADGTGIQSIDELAAATRAELGLDDLGELDAAVAAGIVSAEQVDAATLSVCAVADTPIEPNIAATLRRAGIPYTVERVDDLAAAVAGYSGGDCDGLAAERAALSAELAAGSVTGTILPLPETPLRLDVPRIEGLNFVGGLRLSPNFAAILIGLTIYTGAFIAEIVRAGIQSVAKGQSEAARALGLSEGQRLRLVVLPQALRVIIPPLTSQYLNLTKNSSLAIAVGYPDLWSTAYTTLNQSGRVIQIFFLAMGTYLFFSLTISFFLNWYNRRVALVER